jgi:hypothetical protein
MTTKKDCFIDALIKHGAYGSQCGGWTTATDSIIEEYNQLINEAKHRNPELTLNTIKLAKQKLERLILDCDAIERRLVDLKIKDNIHKLGKK